MAASSSFSLVENHDKYDYEVFISFRGSDVRSGFLSHLHHALEAEQIHAFIDNYLERGKDIAENLFKIIEQSLLSVVIFSKKYPKSKWCLEELEKIHEYMKHRKQIVVPVFYNLDPSDVQHLKGNYRVWSWKCRDALVAISNLSGFDSRNYLNDAKLIEDIVADVSSKLRDICPAIPRKDGLFGMDSSIQEVEQLLHLDATNDVRMIGIWGMGGIGKTTIASKVFDKIKKKFRGYCFVSNVTKTLTARDGLKNLRDKIICELLGAKDIKTDSPFSVDGSIGIRLKRIEVLLVLDDVHAWTQLDILLGSIGLSHPDSFCSGSRIIVTSRDSQVLKDMQFKSIIYEVKPLKDDKALQLFSWYAFGQNKPRQGYEDLSEEVLRYAQGLPLALVVLGSELKQKPRKIWEDTLTKFSTVNPSEIQRILRVSFDGLDRKEKNIFLDIACCFKGLSKDEMEQVLDSFGYHARSGIDRLIDKSLLKVEIEDEGETITMHDLVQQMGQEIVEEEKERRGQQSRLWKLDDIKDALTAKMGGEHVEIISFQDGDWCYREIYISSEAFIHMSKLRVLHFSDLQVNCPMGLQFLPSSIKWLLWDCYPLYYLPSTYFAHKLVMLRMKRSNLEEINWSKPLVNLKCVDLGSSGNLRKISDLAMALNLRVLCLKDCKNLVEIGSSLENLNKLTSLNVKGCESLSHLPDLPCNITELILEGSGLRRLPSTVGRLTLLERLSLVECVNLRLLPEDIRNLASLEELDVSYSGLVELPESVQNLNNLIKLHLTGCKALRSLSVLPPNLEEFDARESMSPLNEMSSWIVDHYSFQACYHPKKAYRLCVSGCQLPEWMMYRNESGSSLSFDLETNGTSINFIFCLIYSPNRSLELFKCAALSAILQSDLILETEHPFNKFDEKGKLFGFGGEEPQDVLFLWTCNVDCAFVHKVWYKLPRGSSGKIIKCGVHPIF